MTKEDMACLNEQPESQGKDLQQQQQERQHISEINRTIVPTNYIESSEPEQTAQAQDIITSPESEIFHQNSDDPIPATKNSNIPPPSKSSFIDPELKDLVRGLGPMVADCPEEVSSILYQ